MAAKIELSLKLLVETKANRVLFAEADKEFVDFLFRLMLLPIGTVIDLITKENMVGCMGNLYQSIETLSESYVNPDLDKNSLLKPMANLQGAGFLLQPSTIPETVIDGNTNYYGCCNTTGNSYHNYISASYGAHCPVCNNRMRVQMHILPAGYNLQKIEAPKGATTDVTYYGCDKPYVSQNHTYITTSYGTKCPICSYRMRTRMDYVSSNLENPKKVAKPETSKEKGGGGYVKEGATYIVTDDLAVMPMSTISSITILKKFNVKGVDALQENVVKFGMEEALELLKASLQSKNALSNVFLPKTMGKAGK